MDTFSFTISRPDANQEFLGVYSVTIPTPQGKIQILPYHADLIAETSFGNCLVRRQAGTESLKLTTPGLIKVKGDKVTLII